MFVCFRLAMFFVLPCLDLCLYLYAEIRMGLVIWSLSSVFLAVFI
jgi:hypothetical protein